MQDIQNLDSDQVDILGEIANISVGNSATSLSIMVRQKVEITTPNVSVINRSEAGDENWIDRSNAGVWRGDNFAGTEFVADSFKNESHTETRFEAEMPIFGISIRKFRELFANLLTRLLVIHA